MTSKRPLLLGLIALAAVSCMAVIGLSARGGEGEAGNGLNYRGSFYRLSSAEVRPAAVGPELNRAVPFQDTTVKVRRIRGVSPDVAVAAYTKTFPGTGSSREYGWLLLSPDADIAADPWAEPQLTDVLAPPGQR